jgi:hypothetical protein
VEVGFGVGVAVGSGVGVDVGLAVDVGCAGGGRLTGVGVGVARRQDGAATSRTATAAIRITRRGLSIIIENLPFLGPIIPQIWMEWRDVYHKWAE